MLTASEWELLDSLTAEQRRTVLSLGRRRAFARNEVVCHEGDPADALHLVVSGHLSVRVSLESGDSVMVRILGPGASFGELALMHHEGTRTATITAIEPAVTIAISGRVFAQLCETHPEVQRALSAMLASRVGALSLAVLEHAYLSLDQRLCRRLSELAGDYAGADGRPVVPLTQSQLAELSGGTRPSVNQALQRLVDRGIVEVGRGRVVVLDVPRLRKRGGDPSWPAGL